MPGENGIRFTSEGGIVANGFPVPVESPRKVFRSFADIARIYTRYGREYPESASDEELIRSLDREQMQTAILLRIAERLDRLIDVIDDVLPVLLVAAEPMAATGLAERDQFNHRRNLEAEAVMADKESRHGPCPPVIRGRLIGRMLKYTRLKNSDDRFSICAGKVYLDRANEDDFCHCQWPTIIPFDKGTSARRKYDCWMRSRGKRPRRPNR